MRREKRPMRRSEALLLTAALLCGTLCGCGDDGTGKGVRFPLSGEPAQLDPQVSADRASLTLISVLFEGLTRIDDSGAVVPGAAEWTVSDDGLTYTFTLYESYWSTVSVRGEELPWEEPQRVTADDFVFGIQRAADPQTRSPLTAQLSGIKGAQAVIDGKQPAETLAVRAQSDSVLTIELTAPDDGFLLRLASAPFLPCRRDFFAYTAGRYGLEKRYVLTNGPFSLTAWNHDTSLLLEKNGKYHAAAGVLPSAVRFVIGADATAQALTERRMDAVLLSAGEAERARDAGITPVALHDTVRFLWFSGNTPVLENADIRRALRDAVEWDAVYAYLTELGETPAAGFVAPDATVGGEPFRTADEAPLCRTDAAAAQAALTAGLAAVYPEDKSPTLPRLTLLTADDEDSKDLARYILQSWQKNLHISATLSAVPESELNAAVRSGSCQIAIVSVTPDGLTGAEGLTMFGSAAGTAAGAALDRAIDAALRGGRAELTALEKQLYTLCPAVPLSFPVRWYGLAPGDEGIIVRPFGGGRYGSPFSFLQAKKFDK